MDMRMWSTNKQTRKESGRFRKYICGCDQHDWRILLDLFICRFIYT